ncbi:hypothetical protein GCM10023238_23120 [Streptomyces heliomycini]
MAESPSEAHDAFPQTIRGRISGTSRVSVRNAAARVRFTAESAVAARRRHSCTKNAKIAARGVAAVPGLILLICCLVAALTDRLGVRRRVPIAQDPHSAQAVAASRAQGAGR